MENLKLQLQNIGENLAFQSKMFFKSHDLAIIIQIISLGIPIILTLISFYLSGGEGTNISKILDYLSFGISVIAIVYYTYFGKNTELYKYWGEKYLVIYKEIENYFKTTEEYTKEEIEKFVNKQNIVSLDLNRPNLHIGSKIWVDNVIDKEMKYGNEDVVWWKK